MTPWHTEDSHNEKTLVNRDLAAYQLRTPNKRSHKSSAGYSYKSPCGYPTRTTAYPHSEAYRRYCAHRRTGMVGTGFQNAGEGATSNKRKTLGRRKVQGGCLYDKQTNDTNIRRYGQGRLCRGLETISLGDRIYGRRATVRSY